MITTSIFYSTDSSALIEPLFYDTPIALQNWNFKSTRKERALVYTHHHKSSLCKDLFCKIESHVWDIPSVTFDTIEQELRKCLRLGITEEQSDIEDWLNRMIFLLEVFFFDVFPESLAAKYGFLIGKKAPLHASQSFELFELPKIGDLVIYEKDDHKIFCLVLEKENAQYKILLSTDFEYTENVSSDDLLKLNSAYLSKYLKKYIPANYNQNDLNSFILKLHPSFAIYERIKNILKIEEKTLRLNAEIQQLVCPIFPIIYEVTGQQIRKILVPKQNQRRIEPLLKKRKIEIEAYD